jgi:uncharacterized protein (TIGR03086 family)
MTLADPAAGHGHRAAFAAGARIVRTAENELKRECASLSSTRGMESWGPWVRPKITIEMHRRVVTASVEVVRRATKNDFTRPTPCTEWRLGGLLAHMTIQHRGFAGAARGVGPDLANWTMTTNEVDPLAAYVRAAALVLEAFEMPDVLERSFWLPEISTVQPYLGSHAIAFHFVDYVVHGWDVARSLGAAFHLDDDLVEAALEVARNVPDGAERLEPGSMFQPSVPVPATAAGLDRTVALLGRSPTWTPAEAVPES